MRYASLFIFLVVAAVICGAARGAQQQYDSGDPTPDEQLVLEFINRARADPDAEGTRLGIDIREGISDPSLVRPRPPLAMNKTLLQVARAHSADMYARSFFDHVNPEGLDPFDRMALAQYQFIGAGENIATSSFGGATTLEDNLMKDTGYPGRGHRVNLLDIRSDNGVYREIGIGYTSATQTNQQGFSRYLVQDFGLVDTTSFLVGVVYDDANANGFYDIGEGLSGVTVTPSSGTHFAVTSSSGGYAFPVAGSGSITVTASGGSLPAQIVKNVTLEGLNVKVDFKLSEAGGGGGGGTVTAPALTSATSASATVGTAFTYQITASGTAPIAFTATGLPAGLSFSNDTISGTPTTAGSFVVSLGASNSAGSDGQLLVISVAESSTGGGTGSGGTVPVVGNTTVDTDADGFPDEIETATGASASNAADTPFGGSSAGTPLPLLVQKLGIRLNFAKPASDSIKFGGTLPIPNNYVIMPRQVTVDVAGVVQTFTLDVKGRSPRSTTASFKLSVKSKHGLAVAQDAKYALKLAKSDFAAKLSDENLINGNMTAIPVAIPVIILFNGQLHRSDEQRLWYAKLDKSGTAK